MEGDIGLEIEWAGSKRFAVRLGAHDTVMDGDSERGLSPMQYLATGVAGCMGIDIALILNKMRTPAQSLIVALAADRAPEPPRRFTGLHFRVQVTGDVPQSNLDRAVALSRDKYCSALATFKDDIVVTVETEISPPRSA